MLNVVSVADASRPAGAQLGFEPRSVRSNVSIKWDGKLVFVDEAFAVEARISKAGDMRLRRLLVQGAQYILGPFCQDSVSAR